MRPSELIKEKSRWTQNSMAKNARGQAVDSTSTDAVRWCAYGACLRCMDQADVTERIELQSKFDDLTDSTDITSFNDSRSHEEVLSCLRKAGL